jgi:hypothetical protein
MAVFAWSSTRNGCIWSTSDHRNKKNDCVDDILLLDHRGKCVMLKHVRGHPEMVKWRRIWARLQHV